MDKIFGTPTPGLLSQLFPACLLYFVLVAVISAVANGVQNQTQRLLIRLMAVQQFFL